MIKPQHGLLDNHTNMSPRRMMSLAVVGVLHIAFIYAVVTGLAQKFVKHIPPVLEATIVDQSTPEPKEMAQPKVQMEQPSEPTIQPPDFQVQTDTPPPIQVAVAPQAPTAPPVSAAATSVTNTHTTPPYPEQARRAGVQGTVLHLMITAQGTVSSATVVTSSGNPELDANAVSWVVSHWKYKPALASGTPVASEADANVVYDLKKAR